MKRIVFSLLFFITLIIPSWGQFRTTYVDPNDSETQLALKEHVSYLASPSMRGRAAGSPEEEEVANYVKDILEGYGVDVLSGINGDLFGLDMGENDTLRSRNVIGYIQGYDAELKDHYIVIGASMDNIGVDSYTVNSETRERIYYGANSNASGVASLLELARMLSTNSIMLRRSVLLVAFGASEYSYAGAWYFLNRSFKAPENIDAMINLDILGTGAIDFFAYTSANADMDKYVNDLAATLQPVHPKLVVQEPFSSDYKVFYDKGIPSVLFTTGLFPEYNTDRDQASIISYDYMERQLEYIYNFSVSLVNGPKPSFNPAEEMRKKAEHGLTAIPYYDCDIRPSFLGTIDPNVFMQKWVYQYLRYPQEAVENGIQGRVLVEFEIDEKGKVCEVKVLRGVDSLLDEEAVRVISASPDWKPGRVNGKKVRTSISVYVDFRLEKKTNR